MWPIQFPKWFTMYGDDAALQVRGRLRQYPVLRGFEERLLGQGLGRAEQIGVYLQQHPDYFRTGPHFSRWLRVVLYREALRLLFPLEQVEVAFERLGDDDRRVLRLRYVDQLCDDEAARVLELRHPGRADFDPVAARCRSLQAYEALCARLPKGAAGFEVASPFPLFPSGVASPLTPRTAP